MTRECTISLLITQGWPQVLQESIGTSLTPATNRCPDFQLSQATQPLMETSSRLDAKAPPCHITRHT